jgi:hypothetical protein
MSWDTVQALPEHVFAILAEDLAAGAKSWR